MAEVIIIINVLFFPILTKCIPSSHSEVLENNNFCKWSWWFYVNEYHLEGNFPKNQPILGADKWPCCHMVLMNSLEVTLVIKIIDFSFWKFCHKVPQLCIHNGQCNILSFSLDNYFSIAGSSYMLTFLSIFTNCLICKWSQEPYPNMMKYQGLFKAFSTVGFNFR